MKFGYNSKQFLAGLTFGFLVVTGTYNAIVINSESVINGSQYRLAKSLDEVYGITVSNRDVANTMAWQKLSIKQAAIYEAQISDKNLQPVEASNSSPSDTQAAVKDDLNLSLTGVINPQKWAQGLNNTQFSGNLATNQGVIESLSVSLPKGEGISVSFSEMTGNVFEYDYEGELYSGMMYQEDQNSYVVTLTNGPLEGTRLTFKGESTLESDVQQTDDLAGNNDADAGAQQEQAPEQEVVLGVAQQNQEMAQPEQIQQENLEARDIYAQEQGEMEQNQGQQAQGFNFEQTQAAL